MDDQLKARLYPAAVAAGLTVIIYQLAFNANLFGFRFEWYKLALGLLIGAVIGGAVYAVLHFTQK